MTDPQVIVNLGTGGSDLNGQNGSTSSADSNDARFLDWPGDNAGNYIYLSGSTANDLRVPDEAALDITGDIDLRAYLSLDDWTATQTIISKESPGMSYALLVLSSGALQLRWSANGSTVITKSSTASATVTDGEPLWIRATLDVDNGASGNDVKFYTSSDGSTWTQLGATVTTAGTTSIYVGTQQVKFGNYAGTFITGKFYRAQILDGIDGTTVLDVDTSVITSGSATSFTAATGQTVTINRSTSGRKSVAVVSPVWLFGTDDYMEVADNALLDFGASDSFTLVSIHRPWSTQGTNDTLLAKKANTTNATAGYNLSGGSSTALQGQAQIGDGTAGITAVSDSRTSGALTITAAVRNVATDDLIVYNNGTAGSAVTDTTTSAISNADVFRIGRLSGAGTEYADMELVGVALFRRALSATEIVALTSYYQNRLS